MVPLASAYTVLLDELVASFMTWRNDAYIGGAGARYDCCSASNT
jgi:hypothetical protein